ncbi:hypothetical protein GTY67_13370 [Streptomyces sp. SID8374]|uniref:hypothetical protein n=1 Tax=Streptomyces sp. SID8374 TaxID=2690354 RepID=UPI001371DEF3|nr:hypothetical protein [Streptomyces sp. SID8374]MYX14387.1 hypothetical protein [Streptomyces sp. SID8374]
MSDTVKMRLTFPRGKAMPGETVEVPADEVHRWRGFAEVVDDKKADEAAKTAGEKNPTTGSQPQKAAGK